MANIKVFYDKQTDKLKHRQTDQQGNCKKLHAPDLSMGGGGVKK